MAVLTRTLAALALCLSGALAVAQARDDSAPAAPESPSYATAAERLAPLRTVAGSAAPPLCEADTPVSERYAPALAYAEQMDSYALLVWRGGRCEFAHYFPPHGPGLRPETASMHKSVVALTLAAAIADGHIGSVDDPVGRYIAEWRDDPRGDITLRQVATMASGLKPFDREGGMQSESWRYVMGMGDTRGATLSRPLEVAPDSRFYYSGFNTQLLLMVIEAATGQAYADYLSQRLWQPLGAGDALLWMYEEEPAMPRAFTTLLARAEDWLRVGLLIKDLGRFADDALLPASLVRELSSPSIANPNYGWQLWLGEEYAPRRYYNENQAGFGVIHGEPFAVDDLIYFDGFGGQRVYISRSEDLVIVRQGELRYDWDDAVLPNLIIGASAEVASQ